MFLKPPTTGQCPGKTTKRIRPEEGEEDLSAKKKYEIEKRWQFQPKWLSAFPWLGYDGGVMFCSVCRDFPDNANK